MTPLSFQPILKQIRWGGIRLGTVLQKPIGAGTDWAESWEVSDHGDDQSIANQEPWTGCSLSRLVREQGPKLMGRHAGLTQFPLLIKFLDASDRLSVQVHPNDEQAKTYDANENGKTEAWVVIDAEPGSRLYVGLKEGIDRATLKRSIEEGCVEDCLHDIPVEAGDCVFIPAGTVHAIGEGILLAEVQQSSDLTFRLYDWGRLGADGEPRELHVEAALDCIDFDRGPVTKRVPRIICQTPANTNVEETRRTEELVASDYFVMRRHVGRSDFTLPSEDCFHVLMTLSGSATLRCGDADYPAPQGATWLIPAAAPDVLVVPDGDTVILDTHCP